MISNPLRAFIFSLFIGISTGACSSDDLKTTPPIEESVVDLSKPRIFLFSSRIILQQSTFIEKAVTDKGTERVETEWEEQVRKSQPVSFTISNDRLEVYFATGENKAFATNIKNNQINIVLADGTPYLFATLSKDNKNLSVVSSFYKIKGVNRIQNTVKEDYLQVYVPIGLHNYNIKYDHLKEIQGQYLRIAFEYKIKP
ncbi:hypothetical protein LNQ81_16585 [Myroides sp. M-43]|uniref:hypothetical protein n=1 Tax=Myroides oncorhynchi TaxID=2893756 RepID=UPI001E409317|nr:hypothetical protein [Myroides oncorhynchi]MCC9044291.1 hypothetical protein [Myroides oncorhynchi]